MVSEIQGLGLMFFSQQDLKRGVGTLCLWHWEKTAWLVNSKNEQKS